MSVSLQPSRHLAFNRPLTKNVMRVICLSNLNDQPVAFKVKTTSPSRYTVRPNSGRIEIGETVMVQVTLRALKREPPSNAKCDDKFLVESTIITPDKKHLSPKAIVEDDEAKIKSRKFKAVYVPGPSDGQALNDGRGLSKFASIWSLTSSCTSARGHG